jgi:hypothetical protein
MFLDDDDFLESPVSLSKVAEVLEPDTLSVWQLQYQNGQKIPSNGYINDKVIALANIGSPCFGFHHKWKDQCSWDKYKCGDYRFIDCLKQTIPNKSFHDMVIVKVPQAGFGKKQDIV